MIDRVPEDDQFYIINVLTFSYHPKGLNIICFKNSLNSYIVRNNLQKLYYK